MLRAAGDGRVQFAGRKGGYGNVVTIDHGKGISTVYGHMSRFGKSARVGRAVKQGDIIGYVGMTGTATGPHLHYEYRIKGVHKNPATIPMPMAANPTVEKRARPMIGSFLHQPEREADSSAAAGRAQGRSAGPAGRLAGSLDGGAERDSTLTRLSGGGTMPSR